MSHPLNDTANHDISGSRLQRFVRKAGRIIYVCSGFILAASLFTDALQGRVHDSAMALFLVGFIAFFPYEHVKASWQRKAEK